MNVLISSIQLALNKENVKHKLDCARVEEWSKSLMFAEEQVLKVQEAQKLTQEYSQFVQTKAHKQVSRVVSKCLEGVFSEPYQFQIVFEKKRGKTEAEFWYYKDGNKMRPIMTSGGVRSVTAIALRLISLVLSPDLVMKFLALDEPFRGVDKKNLQKMGKLLETLSKEMGMQLLVVTHDEELKVGSVIDLEGDL